MRKTLSIGAAATLAVFTGLWAGWPSTTDAAATEHVVELRNRGDGGLFVFEPMLLRIQPGDSVTFVPVDNGHNSQSIDTIAPDDAITWRGKISTPITIAFEQEGAYGVRCAPHFTLGMVGLIIVGDPSPNLDAAATVQLPKTAQSRMVELLGQAQQLASTGADRR